MTNALLSIFANPSNLLTLEPLPGSAGRSHGAAALVDRPLAKAEFRAYIKAAIYCQYRNHLIRKNRSFEADESTHAFPPLLAP